MSLMIVNRNGLLCPMVICDFCGKPITPHEEGAYVWADTREGQRSPMEFYHIRAGGPCLDGYEALRREKANWHHKANWDHLDVLFPYLLHNLKIDVAALAAAYERTQMMDNE